MPRTLTRTVTIGGYPESLAVNPVTNKVYVGSQNKVTIMDGETNALVNLPVTGNVGAMVVNPVTKRIYVANGDKVIDRRHDASHHPSSDRR